MSFITEAVDGVTEAVSEVFEIDTSYMITKVKELSSNLSLLSDYVADIADDDAIEEILNCISTMKSQNSTLLVQLNSLNGKKF